MEAFGSKKIPKNPLNFHCKICDYNTSNKKDFVKHVSTDKHKNNAFGSILEAKNPQKSPYHTEYICTCTRKYKTRGGLWKHQQLCKKSDFVNTDISSLTNLVLEIVKSNGELQKQNQDIQKQFIDVCKNGITNNSITQVNSHNKTFNLNFFLNEQCKDAMNIMEFVDSLQLQFSDLENVGRLGFVNGISDIIIKNLKALDIHKRPVHCADLKREVMYVKDEDQWNKEADNNKIRRAIKCIAQKNTKNLVLFKQKHPDCLQGDSRSSDQYNKLMREAFGGGSDDDANENKIISRMSKEVTIDRII
jgi:hypothetical protein